MNPLAGLATGAAVVGAIIAATKLFDNQANAAARTGGNTVSSSSLPTGFTAGTPVTSNAGSTGGVSSGGISNGGIATGGGTVIGSLPVFPSGLNPTGRTIPSTFDVAAARRGEERGNVIINVNAPSVIDEEGFSRAVALALNNSNRRTGGGGSSLITQDVQ